MTDFILGRIVAHGCGKQRHFPQITRHHYDARYRNEPYIARKKHHHPASRIDRDRSRKKYSERYFAAQKTEQHTEDCGKHEYRAEHQHIVFYAEEILDVNDKIGHVYVVGYAYHADSRIYQIKIPVFCDNGRTETVDELFEKSARLRLKSGTVLYKEKSDDAHDRGYRAEHPEEKHPLPFLRKGIEYAENNEQCRERHYLQYALRFSAGILRSDIGYPRIERGIVGGRTYRRHYAVHNDDHDGRKSDGVGGRKELF